MIAGLGLAGAALAQDAEDAGDGRKSLWELGAAGAGGQRPAYPGSDVRLDAAGALPYGIYRGRYLRAGDGGLRVRARKTERSELDVGFSGSLGFRSRDVPIRAGMPDVGHLIEAGPRWRLQLGPWLPGVRTTLSVPLRGVFDLQNDLRDRGLTFEPSLRLSWQPVSSVSIGLGLSRLFGNQRYNQLIYGVTETQVKPEIGRTAFTARAGLISTRLSLSSQWLVDRDLRVASYLRYDTVRGAANADSPLVRSRGGLSAGVGVSWTLYRSAGEAED